MLGHLRIDLAHSLGIDVAADDRAEYIGGHKKPLGSQVFIGVLDKFRDHVGLAAASGHRLVKDHIPHGPLSGKTDVIELDLVEAGLLCFRSHLHQVVPDLLPVGIHPGHPLPVPVKAPVSQMQAPLRLFLRQPRIPEGHHPGDHIQAPFLQRCDEPLHILDIGTAGADL